MGYEKQLVLPYPCWLKKLLENAKITFYFEPAAAALCLGAGPGLWRGSSGVPQGNRLTSCTGLLPK